MSTLFLKVNISYLWNWNFTLNFSLGKSHYEMPINISNIEKSYHIISHLLSFILPKGFIENLHWFSNIWINLQGQKLGNIQLIWSTYLFKMLFNSYRCSGNLLKTQFGNFFLFPSRAYSNGGMGFNLKCQIQKSTSVLSTYIL